MLAELTYLKRFFQKVKQLQTNLSVLYELKFLQALLAFLKMETF